MYTIYICVKSMKSDVCGWVGWIVGGREGVNICIYVSPTGDVARWMRVYIGSTLFPTIFMYGCR